MKVRLQAGAEVDFLTVDEMNDALDRHATKLADLLNPENFLDRATKVTSDGSGNVAETAIYRVPVGYEARLHRISVEADGYTPGSPLTTGGAWLALWRNGATRGNLVVPFPATSTTVLPTVISEGNASAKTFKNGSLIVCSGGGLPANLGIYWQLQIRLLKITGDYEDVSTE